MTILFILNNREEKRDAEVIINVNSKEVQGFPPVIRYIKSNTIRAIPVVKTKYDIKREKLRFVLMLGK